jgi:hypothetical protein
MRRAEHEARIQEMRNAHTILAGKPEEKRPLVSPRRRWEDNTEIDTVQIRSEGVDWIHLTQDRDQ